MQQHSHSWQLCSCAAQPETDGAVAAPCRTNLHSVVIGIPRKRVDDAFCASLYAACFSPQRIYPETGNAGSLTTSLLFARGRGWTGELKNALIGHWDNICNTTDSGNKQNDPSGPLHVHPRPVHQRRSRKNLAADKKGPKNLSTSPPLI